MLRDFKAFVTKQSLVDLAVGLVIALAAFALITNLLKCIPTPRFVSIAIHGIKPVIFIKNACFFNMLKIKVRIKIS